MDVSVIYISFYSYKTQFIWRLLCIIHGLLLQAVIFSPAKKVSVPFRSVELCDDSSVPFRSLE